MKAIENTKFVDLAGDTCVVRTEFDKTLFIGQRTKLVPRLRKTIQVWGVCDTPGMLFLAFLIIGYAGLGLMGRYSRATTETSG